MRTVGVFLIHAGVFLRCLFRLPRLEHPASVITLLALNTALLILEATVARRQPTHRLSIARETVRSPGEKSVLHAFRRETGSFQSLSVWGAVVRPLYLLTQAGIVVGLLFNRPTFDFFALLFTPISVSAVLYYGRRSGFVWITAFALAMAVPLVALHPNPPFGAVMALNYGGLCFLMGGYAHQIRQAQTARVETQHMLAELQSAHAQLQRAASQREELAAEHERNRLARELHDSVTQTVFSMNLTVQAARLLLNRDIGRVASQLQRLEELASNAMHEIRALVTSLHPALPAEERLTDSLRRLAAERQDRDGLQVTLEVEGNRKLSEPVSYGLYLIAQEALTNVAKHAGSGEATVRLSLTEGASYLEVEDRGCGLITPNPSDEHGHLGLAGMAERARDLGWRLTIASQLGRGTRVRVEENPRGGPE